MSAQNVTHSRPAGEPPRQHHFSPQDIPVWLSWLVGGAALAAVIYAAAHFSEQREFIRLLKRAEPWWLFWAIMLQICTYIAQGAVWLTVTHAARCRLSIVTASKLGVAKLFIDQALPSTGISGTIVVANALKRFGLSSAVVMSGILVDLASYYAAYVLCLAIALAISVAQGHASGLIIAISILFAVFAVAVTVTILGLSGRQESTINQGFRRMPWVGKVLKLMAQADPHLVRRSSVFIRTTGWQLAIVLLDAATIWFLIRALGADALVSDVFASFVISTLFRTIGILPGGLGAFEAASVLTLKLVGVSVPVALAATLLFRGLSFWLPMIPGLFLSRGALGRRKMSDAAAEEKSIP